MKRIMTKERRPVYVRRLKQSGVQILGHGFNSHVFQHPVDDDIAVKVVDYSDHVYRRFMKWSMKNNHNPFVPRFYDYVKVDCIDHHDYMIVFMEKLEEINQVEYDDFLDKLECIDTDVHTSDVLHASQHAGSDDLRALLRFLLTRPSSLDLHQANFMKRGKQIVFIDPFAGG